MPSQFYAYHMVRFPSDTPMPEAQFRQLIADHGFSIAGLNYRMSSEAKFFEYRMVIRTQNQDDVRRLSETLSKLDSVLGFRISPTSD